ncbi:RHS repeat domain-containing protein [Aquimarina celericrescens]|uniref:RHS repeat domain-containing protein n=1 Tax=Aquimarina celericrescens TaxID=1964542 RepID=A0ABW5AV14_9FLAO
MQEKNYYPFGLAHKGYNDVTRGRNHTYGFGNKEEQDEIGLGWIDITARNYDPALGRWMNIDPLAEQMRRHSPYNYGFDNPVYFIDPDGMKPFGGPIKKKIRSSKSGNVNPIRTVSSGFKNNCLRCGPRNHSVPTSRKSSNGQSTEYSKVADDLNTTLGNILTGGKSLELTYSVSKEVTTTTAQYFDSEGNKVSSIDEASNYMVNTNTTTSTVDVNIDDISKDVNVTNTSTTVSYDVTNNPDVEGGKELTNANLTSSESSMSTINFDEADQDLKNDAKLEAKNNVINALKSATDKAKGASKSMEKNLWESMKKF